ncbi:MAG: septum formation initiator family protein [Candidatus Woesearchaeota archaeon]
MPAKKFTSYRSYTNGNTDKKLYVIKESKSINLNEKLRKKRKARKSKNNLGYNIVLFIAILGTILVCVSYLKTEMKISDKNQKIKILQKEYIKLKDNNNVIFQNIDKHRDLEEVYIIAIEELGMAPPNKEQITYYKDEGGSYMYQYIEIKEKKEKTNPIFTSVLGFITN